MALSLKSALITTVISTGIIGGGIGGVWAFQQNAISIEQKLKNEEKVLLNANLDDRWEIKFSTYDKETKSKNLGITLASSDVAGLKKWCIDNSKKDFNAKNQDTYQGVKEICTVPTIREKFLKESKDLTPEDEWANKLRDYKTSGTNDLAIPNINKDNVQDANEIKQWCNEEKNKEYKNDTQQNYKAIVKWCTKLGT